MTLRFKRLDPGAILPAYAHEGDAGMDLCANQAVTIEPGAYTLVGTGWALALPPGTEGQVRPRSGLALKHGVTVLNSPGTIDEGYRGELGVVLINHGKTPFNVTPGMRIAQLVIATVTRATIVEEGGELTHSARGQDGFGSTGT
ncbi:MAG: dUTP diphosphatase [Lentisphaerae bacterium]|jgi:dUTP pyrophosphatase|nr:dUTP diphosphatase [Lentisphaerota bacterium]